MSEFKDKRTPSEMRYAKFVTQHYDNVVGSLVLADFDDKEAMDAEVLSVLNKQFTFGSANRPARK